MVQPLTLSDASKALYELLAKHPEMPRFAFVSLDGNRITFQEGKNTRRPIITVEHAGISGYFVKLGEQRGSLAAIEFPLHFLRTVINTFEDVDDYFHQDLLLFEATLSQFAARNKGKDSSFVAYCAIRRLPWGSDVFAIYRKNGIPGPLPVQSSVPPNELWRLVRKVYEYSLTPDAYMELTGLLGTDLLTYDEHLIQNLLKVRKLKALIAD